MKTFWLTFITVVLTTFGSCSSNDDAIITEVDFKSPSYLSGKWQMTGSYISSGGPQYYVEVSNGEVLEFSPNGTFTSSKYPNCKEGTYTLEDDKLIFIYNCAAFENEYPDLDGKFVYTVSNDSGKLILSPFSRLCVEGCSYYYQKISN